MDDYPAAFSKEDTTGTQSVREAAEFLHSRNIDRDTLWFAHNGKRYAVEVKVLHCEDCIGEPTEAMRKAISCAILSHLNQPLLPEVVY